VITPDTKDWTWVVERPCPECGYDAATVTDVPALLRDNAASWRAVVHDRQRPDDSTWSPLEYACHVRDVYRLYAYRLDLMLTQHDPLYPNWDQDAAAVEGRYGEQDPATVATELEQEGEQVAAMFDRVTGDQWQRTGRRSDGASFTVDTFARYLLHDVVHHHWDVRRPPL
jgi:hypothetical protein